MLATAWRVDTVHMHRYPPHPSSPPLVVLSYRFGHTYIALLAVVADKAVVDTTPHLAHLRVNPVCGSLICLRDTKTTA